MTTRNQGGRGSSATRSQKQDNKSAGRDLREANTNTRGGGSARRGQEDESKSDMIRRLARQGLSTGEIREKVLEVFAHVYHSEIYGAISRDHEDDRSNNRGGGGQNGPATNEGNSGRGAQRRS